MYLALFVINNQTCFLPLHNLYDSIWIQNKNNFVFNNYVTILNLPIAISYNYYQIILQEYTV